jgi:HPt (histidine-containing phosphotransfer) domain-containing protein
MPAASGATLQQAMDLVESLPQDVQEELVEMLQRRMSQRRRAEIARNAEATRRAVREGRAKIGSVEDLERDLV